MSFKLLLQYLVFFHFLPLQIISSLYFNSSEEPSARLCSPEESSALLHFRNSITTRRPSSAVFLFHKCDETRYLGSYPKTESWKEGSDCCSWDGVNCDRLTGHVTGLDLSYSWLWGTLHPNSSLFLLHHLVSLNLACNEFDDSKISSNFGQLTKLAYLNLSSSFFFGQVPTEIFHLSKLVSLDLSYNFGLQLDQQSSNQLTQNLTELRELILDNVDMSSFLTSSLVNLSSSLISLSLRGTNLRGEFPDSVFRSSSLQRLHLSSNNLGGHLPHSNWSSPLRLLDLSSTMLSGKLPDSVGNLIHLSVLDLSWCLFEGSIPASIGNLTGITSLNLRNNSFSGQVPASISKLSQLSYLDLQGNNFSGAFPDVFANISKVSKLYLRNNRFRGQLPSSAFNLTQLSSLDSSNNLFEGHFPGKVRGLPYLTSLILSHNFLNGSLPSWLFCLPSLKNLVLSNNKIYGPLPNFTFELVNVISIDLSSNNLSGIINPDSFSKLQNLRRIDLSYNSLLSLQPNSSVNFTLPKLAIFTMSSCNVSKFPMFLRASENLTHFDFSNNKISGRISKWELEQWDDLILLNLSHNFLTSFGENSLISPVVLDLRSNILQEIMIPPPGPQFAMLSNNKLMGEIQSFCGLSNILVLDLSNNSLSGIIPQCLVNGSVLSVLDLRMNNFHGSIPQTFSDKCFLVVLNLNGNQLEGPLPPSLANCPDLQVLDVGNNNINDTFPHSLAALRRLRVLILRSNKFHGEIGNFRSRSAFPNLGILDLSHNRFTGPLPKNFFENFESMMHVDNATIEDRLGSSYYRYSLVFTVKGNSLTLERTLTILKAIDLSNNQLQGQISEEVGKFKSIMVLNFSLNNLSGHIPSSLGNLGWLESLDLSSNNLVGRIPNQLISLTFLSKLNLSYNKLVGAIPQGNQFTTFHNDSYIGNLGLCGFPLSENCDSDETPKPVIPNEEDNASNWLDWKVIIMGYGSGLVIGWCIAYVVFSTKKPRWFVRMIERGQLKIVTRLNERRRRRRRN